MCARGFWNGFDFARKDPTHRHDIIATNLRNQQNFFFLHGQQQEWNPKALKSSIQKYLQRLDNCIL